MTDKQEYIKRISQYVAKWQNLLKLNEWNIAVGIGTRETMGDNNGSISYVRKNGLALLTIIDPDEAIIGPFGYDAEATIVTQLLNLRYEAINDPSSDIYLARANKIVAFLKVRRRRDFDLRFARRSVRAVFGHDRVGVVADRKPVFRGIRQKRASRASGAVYPIQIYDFASFHKCHFFCSF